MRHEPRPNVFSQLIEHLQHKEFHKCIARYNGDHSLKSFSCLESVSRHGLRSTDL